jgi:general secretion pathway protein D/type IV pilus assembly protein PilQ
MMMIACLSFLSAETPKINFEFIDQPYSDILYAMSRFSGFSIIADDTVTGKTSFQFAGNSFAQAFDSFLLVHRLYVTRNDKTWTVSRFLISKDERGTSVDATDIGAARLIEALSATTGETIVGETLPTDNLSIHVSAASPEEIARAIVKPFPGYTVDRESGSLLVRKKINAQQQTAPLARMSLTRSEGLWNLEINQANFSELVERISREERLGYSNFVRNAPPLAGILASSETLDGIVAVVVEQAGAECVIKNGIRYYLPAQASDAAKRIRESDCDWETFTSSSIRMDRALPLLQARFPGVQFLAATQTDTCVAKIGKEQKKNVDEFLALVDRSEPIETIRLRYISTQDFLKTLPPAIRREDISDTGTGHSFFYVGPQSAKELLRKELKEIDVPNHSV